MGTVKVACCLPHGLLLEIGTPGTPSYKSVELTGVIEGGAQCVSFPDRKGLKFGVTVVPSEIWNTWTQKNKTLRYLVDGSVFAI